MPLWFAATGAEEVGLVGMMDFLRRHGAELRDAAFFILDNIGAGRPKYAVTEGMIRSYPLDPDLIGLAARVAAAHPEWGATGAGIHGREWEVVSCWFRICLQELTRCDHAQAVRRRNPAAAGPGAAGRPGLGRRRIPPRHGTVSQPDGGRSERTPPFRGKKWQNRVRWVRMRLIARGEMASPARGVWGDH